MPDDKDTKGAATTSGTASQAKVTLAPPAPQADKSKLAATDVPATFTPYTAPSEIIPGGLYRRHTKMRGPRHYGGDVANADGVVLAEFDVDQENTGWPGDGGLTKDGKDWMKVHGDKKSGETTPGE